MKLVINICYGGFSLSRAAVLRAREIANDPTWGGVCIAGDVLEGGIVCKSDYGYVQVPRHDATLVAVVEEMGKAANNTHADLAIEDIPAGTHYRIAEYDGNEAIECRDEIEWLVAT